MKRIKRGECKSCGYPGKRERVPERSPEVNASRVTADVDFWPHELDSCGVTENPSEKRARAL